MNCGAIQSACVGAERELRKGRRGRNSAAASFNFSLCVTHGKPRQPASPCWMAPLVVEMAPDATAAGQETAYSSLRRTHHLSKTILITGASSGIGRATARRFQAAGWSVIATVRSPERETELIQFDGVRITRHDVLEVPSIATARHYLQNTGLPVSEISFLLGFGEPSSFYRAFRDWTGQSPDHLRRRDSQQAPHGQ